MSRAFRFATAEARESADTQALLTCAEKEEENQEARENVWFGGWVRRGGKYWDQGLLEVYTLKNYFLCPKLPRS